ncbi:MAG TPA: UdgX family uracil-DNA binding protein [Xanthobacteraceae bacterium]|jgi:uracil-DNA glycosylase family protein|nr:UdgX family uracil-DNA binding protein [Xanthobacteraceae bacterium]
MPKKHWPTMPETRLVPSLVPSAGTRVDAMTERASEPPPKYPLALERRPLRPQEAMPAEGLEAVRREAEACTRCPLYAPATQLVFGEGPADASLMFVGEQPGDQEDLAGRPFIGPAGQVFERALAAAGIVRKDVYVTGAVKHFKFEPRGKRRIHSKPGRTEVVSCRHWLDREIAAVRPKLIVALGATAAFSLAGRAVAVTKERGSVYQFGGQSVLVTLHPSYVLRIADVDAAARAYDELVVDLKLAARWLNGQSYAETPQLSQAS